MPTPTTSARHISLRSPFAASALVALLLALAGAACSSRGDEAESSGDSAEFGLSIGAGNLTLSIGESVEIQTTVSTTSAARLYTLQYQSSNTKVATVSSAGLVTALAAGSAQINVTARLLDTGGSASAVVKVAVGSGGVTLDAGTVADGGSIPTTPGPTTRNVHTWPFAPNSIWNMPIGSGAVFANANLAADFGDEWAEMPGIDEEHIVLRPTAPMTTINYSNVGWSGKDRCAATGGALVQVPMPADDIVPNSGGNVGAAFLMPDGKTLLQVQPLARCVAGGPGTALVKFAPVDIYGDGRLGAHGGSGLSSIGGSIRVGELRPNGQGPRHALKVNVYARQELARCTVAANCFRWPAATADSYATTRYGTVGTPSPAMKMGALLAIPGNVAISSIGLETEPAKQLAWTLQNYGAYIVDDSWGAHFGLSTEEGPDGSFAAQFKADWGFAVAQRVRDASPWVRDIQRLRAVLKVVDNNGPNSIGGGGTPRQPLAPAL